MCVYFTENNFQKNFQIIKNISHKIIQTLKNKLFYINHFFKIVFGETIAP